MHITRAHQSPIMTSFLGSLQTFWFSELRLIQLQALPQMLPAVQPLHQDPAPRHGSQNRHPHWHVSSFHQTWIFIKIEQMIMKLVQLHPKNHAYAAHRTASRN